MKLHMFLHDDLAATFDTGSGQLAKLENIHWTTLGARVSASWEQVPSLEALTHWLEACLPENGARIAYEERARALKLDLGEPPLISGPIDILWGNTDAEYPGAIHFRRDGETKPDEAAERYVRLADKDIGARLHQAWRVASQASKGPEQTFSERRSSLSGVRGKIGLTRADDGAWLAARGSALNTWIAKREADPKLAGEAGVESICQRTLTFIGVPAARTLSRVFAGEQCVLSKRSDRYFDQGGARVRPRHQEEFCQACGWPSALKYDLGRTTEPRWERAYEILGRHSRDPVSAQELLTRILVASWALGHTDLHRRNLGFRHAPPGEAFGVEVAPLYDVSSGVGIEQTIKFEMAIGVARQSKFQAIGPAQWLAHATSTKQDRESVLAIVTRTLTDLPDALAAARDRAREEDENHDQRAVDHRVEAMLAYVEKRHRVWRETLGRMRSAGARGLRDDTHALEKAETAQETGPRQR